MQIGLEDASNITHTGVNTHTRRAPYATRTLTILSIIHITTKTI